MRRQPSEEQSPGPIVRRRSQLPLWDCPHNMAWRAILCVFLDAIRAGIRYARAAAENVFTHRVILWVSLRSARLRFAQVRFARPRFARPRCARLRLARLRFAMPSSALPRSAPLIMRPSRWRLPRRGAARGRRFPRAKHSKPPILYSPLERHMTADRVSRAM